MNARLRARLARRRPLPPPVSEAPANFESIVRRTRSRPRWWLRIFLAAIAVAAFAFVLIVAWTFRGAPFGGIH